MILAVSTILLALCDAHDCRGSSEGVAASQLSLNATPDPAVLVLRMEAEVASNPSEPLLVARLALTYLFAADNSVQPFAFAVKALDAAARAHRLAPQSTAFEKIEQQSLSKLLTAPMTRWPRAGSSERAQPESLVESAAIAVPALYACDGLPPMTTTGIERLQLIIEGVRARCSSRLGLATTLLKRAIAVNEELGGAWEVAVAHLHLAGILDILGRESEAWSHRAEALAWVTRSGGDRRRDIELLVIDACLANGFPDAAAFLWTKLTRAANGPMDSPLSVLEVAIALRLSSFTDTRGSVRAIDGPFQRESGRVGNETALLRLAFTSTERRSRERIRQLRRLRTQDSRMSAELAVEIDSMLGAEYVSLGQRVMGARAFDDALSGIRRLRRLNADFPSAWAGNLKRVADQRALLMIADGHREEFWRTAHADVPDIPRLGVARRALDSQSAVVEYFECAGALWAAVFTRSAFTVRSVASSSKHVFALATELGQSLRQGVPRSEAKPPGGALYDALIVPIRDRLPRGGSVIFALPAQLADCPLNALWNKADDRYLVEELTTAVANVSSLARGNWHQQRPVLAGQVLIVAPSQVDESVPTAPPLLYAPLEADRLARLYPRARLLTGPAVRRDALELELPRSLIVHFAGHASRSSDGGRQLLLGRGPSGEDETIDADDFRHLKLRKGALVVLAACDIAAEADRRFTDAILHAGAAGVIAALWPLNDMASSRLMVTFHEYLQSGEVIERALQKAQVDFLRTSGNAEWTWANVVLIR